MRKNIYGIFRALRHFGVSGKEVEKIANAYKTWLAFPIKEKSLSDWVYYIEGRLISMPFEIKALENHLIGYAYGNKVFLVALGKKVAKDRIENSVQLLKQMLDKRMLGAVENADLQVHIPTKKEVEYIFAIDSGFDNDAVTAEKSYEQLPDEDCEPLFLSDNGLNMWITPDPDEPEMTAVKIGVNNSGVCCKKYRPSFQAKLDLYLVTDFRDGDFIGKLGKYGVPTPATIKMYHELLEKRY